MEKMLTPQDVADKLGITVYRVHQLIRAGRLPATAYGRFYLVSEADLALVAERKPGRPKKEPVALNEEERQFVEAVASAIKEGAKPKKEGAAAVANGAKATTKPATKRKAIKKG